MRFVKNLFRFNENTRMAIETLRDHKMRSALTVLGVFIAVVVLIGVFAVMYGVDADMRAFLEDYGTDVLFIFKFDPGIHIGRLSQEERMRKPLTMDDATAIKHDCPSVKDVAVELSPWTPMPGGNRFIPTAKYQGKEVYDIEFEGATTSYEPVQNTHMRWGRFFTDAEDLHRSEVIVIGYDLAETLFPAHDAVGKEIQVGGMTFTIVGVIDKRKGVFLRDDSADKTVILPYSTYLKHRPQDKENFLTAQAYPGRLDQASDEVTGVLRRRRGDGYQKKDSFGISSAQAMSEQFRGIMSMVFLLTIAVASVGLLVGGVGVMNIMLMSVTERTHEIGVRKAIGARRRDVIRQFLVEALILTGGAGMVAVIFCVVVIAILNVVFPNFPLAVPTWSIAVAMGAAMSVGLFFGIYPATKAAKLDPVEALRYE